MWILNAGHYAYAEASIPAVPGQKIRMVGRTRPATNGQCVSYYYNMNGYQMGSLSVRIRTGPNSEMPLATHSGNLGDKWYINEVTATSSVPWQVSIEAILYHSINQSIS